MLTPVSAATTSVAGFAVDGQIQRQGTDADWADNTDPSSTAYQSTGVLTGFADRAAACDNSTAGRNPVLICDDVKTDSTTFPGGAKESDPSGWLPIQTSQVTPKTDITNVYAYGKVDASNNNDPIILNAMERLPKAGDLHLDFEYNRAVSGSGTQTIPARRPGDLLLAYDLGGGRNSNGNAITVQGFLAVADDSTCTTDCSAHYNYASPSFGPYTGTGTLGTGGVTAQVNGGSILCGQPWKCYDAGYNLADSMPAFGFAEAGIDLKTALGTSSVCFNYVTVKSRSSESVTSQLKDTTNPVRFPFCGGLKVKKYLDYNANHAKGSYTTSTGASATEPYASGWHFAVQGPSPATTVVCEGTTDANGELVCDKTTYPTQTGSLSGLQPGSYTVTEYQQSHFINTQAGSGVTFSTASTPTATKTIGVSTTPDEVVFGNVCYVSTQFRVTGVPSGQTPALWYRITAGYGAFASGDPDGTATMAPVSSGSSTYGATLSDLLVPGATVSWGYSLGASKSAAQSYTVPATGTCSDSTSVQFATGDIFGTKYKDIDGDGVKDPIVAGAAANEVGLANFVFALRKTSDSSIVQYAVSCGQALACTGTDSTGTYRFTNVAPGSYTVDELPYSFGSVTIDGTSYRSPDGWVQTGPLSAGAVTDPQVTMGIGGAAVNVDTAVGPIGNTPLSSLQVVFRPGAKLANGTTDATQIDTVTCTSNSGATSVTGTTTGNTFTSGNVQLKQSPVTCVISFKDP